jgi:hypothetical protein
MASPVRRVGPCRPTVKAWPRSRDHATPPLLLPAVVHDRSPPSGPSPGIHAGSSAMSRSTASHRPAFRRWLTAAAIRPRLASASADRRLQLPRALGRPMTHASRPCPKGPGLLFLFPDGGAHSMPSPVGGVAMPPVNEAASVVRVRCRTCNVQQWRLALSDALPPPRGRSRPLPRSGPRPGIHAGSTHAPACIGRAKRPNLNRRHPEAEATRRQWDGGA